MKIEINKIDVDEFLIPIWGSYSPIRLIAHCGCLTWKDERWFAEKDCMGCKGKGYYITSEGQAILDFLKLVGKEGE